MFLFKASLPCPTLSERCGKRLALFVESREKRRAISQPLVAFWQLEYGRADTKQLCQKGAAPEGSGAGEIAAITQHDPLPGSGLLISF